MRWILTICVLAAAAQNPPPPEDRAAQLEPHVRKFADILAAAGFGPRRPARRW